MPENYDRGEGASENFDVIKRINLMVPKVWKFNLNSYELRHATRTQQVNVDQLGSEYCWTRTYVYAVQFHVSFLSCAELVALLTVAPNSEKKLLAFTTCKFDVVGPVCDRYSYNEACKLL